MSEKGIAIDWDLDEPIWRSDERAFQAYAERRRNRPDHGTRSLPADFRTGAHASIRRYHLLSLDEGLYGGAFPRLKQELKKSDLALP